ncbi:hypothetical protein [Paenibacillus sp. Y412MC10]|uniref:hypothetical protein n=1 Tax=Geobacillus sp. (strain Y412MC10) TaxID=481743 RepID=UPI0011AB7772|nr:hypothetical protein [Paenibacillus sp. Y412MC10]
MEKTASNYILFKKTLGSLLYFSYKHPDPVERKEYRHKFDTLSQREPEYKVEDLSASEQHEVSNLDRLISLYDQYNAEISDLRKSELFSEIIDLSDQLGVSREA